MAYTRTYLKKLSIKKRFLLDKDVLLDGAPELLSVRKFGEIFAVDPMYVVRADKRGLVVKRLNSRQSLRVDTRKTLDKIASDYQAKDIKLEENGMDKAFRTDRPSAALTNDKYNFIKVDVGPKTLVMDKLLPAASEEEMKSMEEKWKQLTGKEEMPKLHKHQISKLLWNFRYMKITNMFLDAHPSIEITTMMMSEWGMTWNQSKRIISMVEKDIIKSVEKRKGFLIGQAYKRYEKLFNEAMKSNDVRTATVINKEIIALYGIDKMATEMLESKASEEDGHMSILAQIEADE